MDTSSIEKLKIEFTGTIILPQDSEYEKAAHVMAVKGAPALVVQPQNTKDVAIAVLFATTNNLVISVRSGGHSVAGFGTNSGGIVIDLTALHAIQLVDPKKHIVRIEAGATWGNVAAELQKYNLAISSGDTKSVGVGGLTLGGGMGWMVRKHGLAIDSLIAAQVVTADGQILNVNATDHPDVFWAIRGGGGNFGIVTHFDFVAHVVGKVVAGPIMFERNNVQDFLKKWGDYMKTATEDLTTILSILPSFNGSDPMILLSCCYVGEDKNTALTVIESLKLLGKVTNADIKEKFYADVLENANPPPDIKVIVDNVFIEHFNDEIIQSIVTALEQKPDMILQIRSLHGSMNRVAPEATAFGYRNSDVMILCPSFMPPAATSDQEAKILAPWKTLASKGQGAYSGFISTRTPEDVTKIYPPTTYERLKQIKKKYDPENIFNQNFNIQP